MLEKEIFYQIADNNFKVFDVVTEENLKMLISSYPNKDELRKRIIENIVTNCEDSLPKKTTAEIYLLLVEFIKQNNINLLEGCALFKIISDVLLMFKKNSTQEEVYDCFKKRILSFSMNRFSYQIGILQKETIYLISEFFINNIYKKFFFLAYSLTSKKNIDLESKEVKIYTLPGIQNLKEAIEILPRNAKIVKQYFVSRRPKTELEQKIDIILEHQREKLEKKMEIEFDKQDEQFNKRLEELTKKKK